MAIQRARSSVLRKSDHNIPSDSITHTVACQCDTVETNGCGNPDIAKSDKDVEQRNVGHSAKDLASFSRQGMSSFHPAVYRRCLASLFVVPANRSRHDPRETCLSPEITSSAHEAIKSVVSGGRE
jgi:hypothetical protein